MESFCFHQCPQAHCLPGVVAAFISSSPSHVTKICCHPGCFAHDWEWPSELSGSFHCHQSPLAPVNPHLSDSLSWSPVPLLWFISSHQDFVFRKCMLFKTCSGYPLPMSTGPLCPSGSSSNWLHAPSLLTDLHTKTFVHCHFFLFPYKALALSTQQLCLSCRICVCGPRRTIQPLSQPEQFPFLPGNLQSTPYGLFWSSLPPPLALLALNFLRTSHASCNTSHIATATVTTAVDISTNQPSFLDQAICIPICFPVLGHYQSPGFIVPLHFQGR